MCKNIIYAYRWMLRRSEHPVSEIVFWYSMYPRYETEYDFLHSLMVNPTTGWLSNETLRFFNSINNEPD